MKDLNRPTRDILLGSMALTCCGLMVLYPELAVNSASKGVTLWVDTVLPALLPFFICANFMVAMGIPELVGRWFQRPFRLLYGTSGKAAFVFLISITSGYPMGPKLIGDLIRSGEISTVEGKRMLSFCSTSGPLFLMGSVGAGMLGSPAGGALIATAHYLGALINGLLFRFLPSEGRSDDRVRVRPEPTNRIREHSMIEILTESILSALRTLGLICAFIVLFMMCSDFLLFFGMYQWIPNENLHPAMKGFLEMTVGCDAAAQLDQRLVWQCVLCAGIISWGGLSILAQSMSVLKDTGIRVTHYIKVKASHSILAGLLAWILSPYFLTKATETIKLQGQPSTQAAIGDPIPLLYSLFYSMKMIIIVLAVLIAIVCWDRAAIRRKNLTQGKEAAREGRRHHR